MPRPHLLLLALGVLIVLAAGLVEDPARDEPVALASVGAEANPRLGAPDLVMETAAIAQFAASGDLAYRILAVEIVHYPEADHTQLTAPRLTLLRDPEPPWELAAERGRILGGTGLLDVGLTAPGGGAGDTPADGEAPGEEVVELEDDVVIQRQRATGSWIELRTEALRLHPGREYAETDLAVIIDTAAGRTIARGLRAQLGEGLIMLGTPAASTPGAENEALGEADPEAASERVRTTIFPGIL